MGMAIVLISLKTGTKFIVSVDVLLPTNKNQVFESTESDGGILRFGKIMFELSYVIMIFSSLKPVTNLDSFDLCIPYRSNMTLANHSLLTLILLSFS